MFATLRGVENEKMPKHFLGKSKSIGPILQIRADLTKLGKSLTGRAMIKIVMAAVVVAQ